MNGPRLAQGVAQLCCDQSQVRLEIGAVYSDFHKHLCCHGWIEYWRCTLAYRRPPRCGRPRQSLSSSALGGAPPGVFDAAGSPESGSPETGTERRLPPVAAGGDEEAAPPAPCMVSCTPSVVTLLVHEVRGGAPGGASVKTPNTASAASSAAATASCSISSSAKPPLPPTRNRRQVPT